MRGGGTSAAILSAPTPRANCGARGGGLRAEHGPARRRAGDVRSGRQQHRDRSLLDAISDSIPIICISGQVATTAIGTDAFQECDALGITRPDTKWNTQIRAVRDIDSVVGKAFAVATQGRPGPVLIDFPKDLQMQCLAHMSTEPEKPRSRLETLPIPTGRIAEAAALIRTARSSTAAAD